MRALIVWPSRHGRISKQCSIRVKNFKSIGRPTHLSRSPPLQLNNPKRFENIYNNKFGSVDEIDAGAAFVSLINKI